MALSGEQFNGSVGWAFKVLLSVGLHTILNVINCGSFDLPLRL